MFLGKYLYMVVQTYFLPNKNKMGEVEEIKETPQEPKDLQVIIDQSMASHKELMLVLGTLFLKIEGVEKKVKVYDDFFSKFTQ